MAAEEAVAEAGIGNRFPGPLFLAVAPVEAEWPLRFELAEASGANDTTTYLDLLRAITTGRSPSYSVSCCSRSWKGPLGIKPSPAIMADKPP